jgi:hypothetical protein
MTQPTSNRSSHGADRCSRTTAQLTLHRRHFLKCPLQHLIRRRATPRRFAARMTSLWRPARRIGGADSALMVHPRLARTAPPVRRRSRTSATARTPWETASCAIRPSKHRDSDARAARALRQGSVVLRSGFRACQRCGRFVYAAPLRSSEARLADLRGCVNGGCGGGGVLNRRELF